MAGRKKKPTALKILHGTDQPCRMNPDEPKPDLEIPDAPALLSEVALVEWERISVLLDNLGLMSSMDTMALAGYCQAYSHWVDAEEDIKVAGLTWTKEDGTIKANPAVAISHQAMNLMLRFLVEFGMTPSSRTKVSGKKKEEEANAWASKKKARG